MTGLVLALVCRGHVLIEGVPGRREDAAGARARRRAAARHPRVQFTPDLMPGDITGSLVYDTASRRVLLPRGPGLHPAPARRRDQPDAAQDAGRAARGDGGAAGHGRRAAAPAARAVRRRGHAEPGRVRGHLPAAGGAARPVPAQAADAAAAPRDAELEVLGRHAGGFDPRDLAAAGVRPVAGAGGARGGHRGRPPGGGRPRRARVRRGRRPRHPADAVAVPRRVARGARPRCWRRAGPGRGCPAATT